MVSREAIVLLFFVFIVFNLINTKGGGSGLPDFLSLQYGLDRGLCRRAHDRAPLECS